MKSMKMSAKKPMTVSKKMSTVNKPSAGKTGKKMSTVNKKMCQDFLSKAALVRVALGMPKSTNTNQRTNMAVMANDIVYIRQTMKDVSDKLEKDYVTRDEFEPVRNVVYGMVGLILVGFLMAVIALIIRK